jgi:hypothetical protein
MKVYEVVRKRFGRDEFVDYPVTNLNRDWGSVEVYKGVDKEEGLTLHGILIGQRDGFDVFSCGGYLACLRSGGDAPRETRISVVPSATGGERNAD